MRSSRPLSCDIIRVPVRSGFPPGRTPQPELTNFFVNHRADGAVLAVRNDQLPPHNDMLMELPGDLTTYYSDEEALRGGDEGVSAIPRLYRYAIEGRILAGDHKGEAHTYHSTDPSLTHPGPTPVDRDPLPDFAVFCHHSQ